MSGDPDETAMLNFEELHWRRIGTRLMSDFRVTAVCAKALSLLGRSPGKILDLGCGAGPFTWYALQNGLDVVEIDNSPHQIEQAHRIFAETEELLRRLRCGNVRDLAQAGEAFHSVVMLDVLEHVEDRVGFLRLARDVVDPAGQMVVCVPANPLFYDTRDRLSGHFLRYDPKTLADEAAAAGFAIKSMSYWNFLGWLHRKITRTASGDSEFAEYAFRYRDDVLARSINWLLRYYFLLLENHLSPPVGMSLFAVLTPLTER